MATFSFDVQIPPASVNVLDVAAGYGTFRVPLTGLLTGDLVVQMRLAITPAGGSTTELTITPQALASGQITAGSDGTSASGSFSLDPTTVALIAAAKSVYSVRVWVTRAGVTKDREVQAGGLTARVASVSRSLNTVTTVTLSPSAATVAPGATQQLAAVAKDAGGNVVAGQIFAWVSSNPSVATVDANGLVTVIAVGVAVLSATVQGVSGLVTITGSSPAFAAPSVGQVPTFRSGAWIPENPDTRYYTQAQSDAALSAEATARVAGDAAAVPLSRLSPGTAPSGNYAFPVGAGGAFRAGVGTPLGAPVGVPTAATNGAGVLVGSYQYVYTEQDGTGETTPSAAVTIVAASNTIRLTVPTPRRGVSQRFLYRKNPGAGSFRLVHAFGGGYFQNIWDDNVADATVAASSVAPTVDTSAIYNLEVVGGVKFFRTHPDQGSNPADVTILTGNGAVGGAYALDVYGTVITRTYAGDGIATIKTGDHGGFAIAAYYQGDVDDGAAVIASWHVNPRGAMQVGSYQVPLLSTEYAGDFRGNAVTTMLGTSASPGVCVLSSPLVANNITALDWSGGESGYVMGRIGVKYGGSGSSMLFGVSNNYASGITHVPLTIDTTAATIAVPLLPSATGTLDMGSGTVMFRDSYLSGTSKADVFTSTAGNKTNRAAAFSAPNGGNSVFFGHNNSQYLSTLGGFSGSGQPFIAFYSYHSSTASTLKRASATNQPGYITVSTTGALQYFIAPAGTVDADIANFTQRFSVDDSATLDNICLLVYDATGAALKRVSRGVADSGGTGFRLLRIPN